MTRRLVLALSLTLLVPGAAFAKCAPSVGQGTSANKKWKAVPTLEGKFTFLEWDESKKDFVIVCNKKIEKAVKK